MVESHWYLPLTIRISTDFFSTSSVVEEELLKCSNFYFSDSLDLWIFLRLWLFNLPTSRFFSLLIFLFLERGLLIDFENVTVLSKFSEIGDSIVGGCNRSFGLL